MLSDSGNKKWDHVLGY